MITIDEIERRLASIETDEDLKQSGLLFHGTAEPFEGDLRPSSYDGVLWFAKDPLFAQAYIPACGLSSIVSKPSDWQMSEHVRPNQHSFWTEFAVANLGREMPDVEHDAHGQVRSWTIPRGWPTYGECMKALADLGYRFDNDSEVVKTSKESGIRKFVAADWLEPGRVYVTALDGLNLLDLSSGEGDLTDPMHKRLDLFREAEDKGYDGIIIDDFAQSEDCGNVGHRAVGLFKAACPRPCFVYPAFHRAMEGVRSLLTVDFLESRQAAESLLKP